MVSNATAASTHSVSIRSGRWSNPDVWHAGRLPGHGDAVTIAEGTVVELDRNISVATLTVSGPGAILSCQRNNDLPPRSDEFSLVLDVATVFLIEKAGCFTCGAGDCQTDLEHYAGRLTIRLTSETPPASPDEDVRTLLVRDGGALYLSGCPRAPAITRLESHALPNDTSIVVSDPRVLDVDSGWNPGDLIAIAPTDYAPSQTEYRKVASVSLAPTQDATSPSATLKLDDRPLAYAHNGRSLKLSGSPNGAGDFMIDTRAEVALLSRNIVIEGVAGDPSGLGGDVKILGRSSRVLVKWCEFRYLGRRGHLGRYPLHLHGAAEGAVITGVSVHDSYQRGIVLHCTSGAQVTDTVVAGVYGFAFMLEDGAEENNVLSANLAMDVLNAIPNTTGSVITEHGNPAGFWFVNPANSFLNNMAAGVHGSGFSWEMLRNRTASYTLCPQEVPGYNVSLFVKQQYSALDASVYGALMRKNFVAFRNNSAHSMHSGIWFRSSGDLSSRSFYPPLQSSIDGFTAWKVSPRLTPPPGVEGSHHDSCVHVSGLSRLKVSRAACVNSARIYWSSESNVLNDTLLAWVDNRQDGSTLLMSESPNEEKLSYVQALVSYINPQTFLNTHVRGKYGKAIFPFMGFGSINSANTIVSGFSYDADSVLPRFELALLSAQSPHVYTDSDGSWLSAGPGARVLASCLECDVNADPIIEAYAPGACLPVGRKSPSAMSTEYVSEPRPATGGVIKALGATPMLCAGPSAPFFSVIQLSVRSFVSAEPDMRFRVFGGKGQYLRAATPINQDTAFFLAPMTRESTSQYGGYRINSRTAWSGIKALVVTMGPVNEQRGGLTIVLGNIPTSVRYSVAPNQALLDVAVVGVGDNKTAGSCASLVAACALERKTGAPCVCRDSSGDLYVRLIGSAVVEPNAYDSRGNLPLFQCVGVQLDWNDHVTPRTAPINDFIQLAEYLGKDPRHG